MKFIPSITLIVYTNLSYRVLIATQCDTIPCLRRNGVISFLSFTTFLFFFFFRIDSINSSELYYYLHFSFMGDYGKMINHVSLGSLDIMVQIVPP